MPVQSTCRECGAAFMANPSNVKRGFGFYCSRACFAVEQRRRVGPLSPAWKGRKPIVDKTNGYLYVGAPGGGRVWLHRLVWEQAHGRIPPNHHIHHVNGIKDDNRIENLRLISASEHSRLHLNATPWPARRHGPLPRGFARGAAHKDAKLTEDQVRAIRTRYATGGVLQRELAAEYGVHLITISQIVTRKTWRHVD